jgi:hypothetical protein
VQHGKWTVSIEDLVGRRLERNALVHQPPRAIDNIGTGASSILSRMVTDALAVARQQEKPVSNVSKPPVPDCSKNQITDLDLSRGKSEQYLKHEHALENYLIDTGLEEASLRLSSGEVRAGIDLLKLVEEARTIRNVFNGLHSRYNRKVLEQAPLPACCGRR